MTGALIDQWQVKSIARCMRVNKEWKAAADNPKLWRYLVRPVVPLWTHTHKACHGCEHSVQGVQRHGLTDAGVDCKGVLLAQAAAAAGGTYDHKTEQTLCQDLLDGTGPVRCCRTFLCVMLSLT